MIKMLRLCPHNNRACKCTRDELQPCLAAVIAAYLEELPIAVASDCQIDLSFRRKAIRDIFRTYETMDDLYNRNVK